VPVTGIAHPRLAPFDALLTSFLKRHQIPGAALAVTKDGRLVHARGFGYADVEAKTLVRPRSRFRIASISKPFTATAILMLVDQGKLRLDARVYDVLGLGVKVPAESTFDQRWQKVTINQLLHHTGGWDRDRSFDPMFLPVKIARATHTRPPATADAIVSYMLGQPLDFEPGREFAYSNFGYCLLGRVIETVSGERYGPCVRANVLAPLGIGRMRLARSRLEGRLPGEVRYYDEPGETVKSVFAGDLGEPVLPPYGGECLEAMDAHGGWVASAVELVRFAAALDEHADPALLSPASRRLMFAPPPGPIGHKDGRPRDSYYACGWDMARDGDGYNSWHGGYLAGTSTLLVRRHDGVTWAVLFNSTRKLKGDELAADLIDGRLHEAANRVESWPAVDLFPNLLGDGPGEAQGP
jgi:N-acyl-D-amino-acid deacylase